MNRSRPPDDGDRSTLTRRSALTKRSTLTRQSSLTRRSALPVAFWALALTLLLVGAGIGAVGASEPIAPVTDPASGTGSADLYHFSVAHDDPIRLQDDLFLVDEPGYVGVTATVEIPDRVRALRITPRDASDHGIEADGFERVEDADEGEGTWEWDGETDRPSVTYLMAANETADGDGPLDGEGSYRFVDAGDWALVGTPVSDVHYSSVDGEVPVVRERGVDGEGVASQAMAFLGPYEEHVHEVSGERFRLIVPEAADPVASPEEVFAAFEYAATALQVGARDEEVVAIAAPTGEVEWAARGIQAGDHDLWVADDEPAGTTADVWTHEYVHTRQSYVTGAGGSDGGSASDGGSGDGSARWFTEATATYYAALFAVERGEADLDEFQRTLARGERQPEARSILDDPTTWRGYPDYTKGSLVAGEIDRQLRTETDGRASLATVFQELNAAADPVTNREFLNAVEDAAAAYTDAETAASIRDDAERYTTTDAVPVVWDREAHAEAFGAPPAQVGYGLASDGVHVTGEYREGPVADDPVRLVAGERLALEVMVRNTGGVAGDYEVDLRVDDEPVTVERGTVDPESDRTETVEHSFEEPGEYEVRVAGETMSVVVEEPASVRISDLSVTPEVAESGETVVVSATAVNDADRPAGGDVQILVGGETIANSSVRLDVDGAETITHEFTATDGGSMEVGVVGPENSATATLTVEGDGPLDGVGDGIGDGIGDGLTETVDEVPGFGPLAAIVALALGALAVTVTYRMR